MVWNCNSTLCKILQEASYFQNMKLMSQIQFIKKNNAKKTAPTQNVVMKRSIIVQPRGVPSDLVPA
ncbi:MAG: hypothetical protein CMI30_07515 [Opitutae bacterium]|nr:hypothetical protein [Opitutae bacterium]